MNHEEFAARHPHPPSPIYVKIDRQTGPAIDRQRETAIDRQPPGPIDQRTPLTYRVQIPKIDVARLNALRPQPTPSANPPETTSTHSDDAAEPMKVDKAPMGRTFRKRKGNAKHLKRKSEYETEYFASIETHIKTSIDNAPQKSIDIHKEESIDSSPGDWENDYYNPTMAVHTSIPTRDTLHTEEYDEDYEGKQAIEYRAILAEEDRLLRYSSRKRNATSIDKTVPISIDTQTSCKRASTDIAHYPSIDTGVDREREGDYSIGNWADDHYHESFAVETAISQPRAYELHEGFTTEKLPNMRERDEVDDRFKPEYRQHTRPSIDIDKPTSIDRRPESGKRAYGRDGTRRFHWEKKDEYEVYRADYGHARDVDGHIIRVSNDDIRSLLERASMEEHIYLCLPEHARSFTQTKLVPEIYTKDEINEMFYGVCGAQEKNEGDFQMKFDEVNQHPVAEVMHVLLRSGQSASREEAVEKSNVCRSMQNS
ncbi:hypothetical protein DY000_02048885 [Brassica cretica]|uniref:Uncharacterized protein n=1 Tax=Brassica cretica TaxID=69181 RepID=A0ABQ7ESH2_BRACR|nr:hypothetical protein DY000_02048885 [Brassica cretica]